MLTRLSVANGSDPYPCALPQGLREPQLPRARAAPRQGESKDPKSQVPTRVEHTDGVIKRVFGFEKMHYRGRAKNRQRQEVSGGAGQPRHGMSTAAGDSATDHRLHGQFLTESLSLTPWQKSK